MSGKFFDDTMLMSHCINVGQRHSLDSWQSTFKFRDNKV